MSLIGARAERSTGSLITFRGCFKYESWPGMVRPRGYWSLNHQSRTSAEAPVLTHQLKLPINSCVRVENANQARSSLTSPKASATILTAWGLLRGLGVWYLSILLLNLCLPHFQMLECRYPVK
jgi:hypothetical protein